LSGLQQDSAEVLINVLSQLETAFEPPRKPDGSKGHNIIAEWVTRGVFAGSMLTYSLFSCEYRQQLIYKTAEGTLDAQTPVNSVFVHPIIGVEEEGKDLYDCLAELYLGGADIEYEGKKGHMMDLMDKFPPMLYIQMRVSLTFMSASSDGVEADGSARNMTSQLGENEKQILISRSTRR
jgi:ubiquitin carboxyl-terminal hydrolase 25/28